MNTTKDTKEWVAVKIAANELGTTPVNLLMHIKNGKIEAEETLDGWRVSVESLNAFKANLEGMEGRHICQSGCKGCGAHSNGPQKVGKQIRIAPGDLRFKYKRNKIDPATKFTGPPDNRPFDRNDLSEVLPMMEVLMTALQTDDGRVLLKMEEVLNGDLPQSIDTRELVYNVLLDCMQDMLGKR